MTDWPEAGRKADATRVRALYRAAFNTPSKLIARGRVIEALRSAGVTTVLDLWGGGVGADAFVAAGFRVIAVENGSMELIDKDLPVSKPRKRRALEYAAREGGYESRWGSVETFASEADGAYLDFCGPWTAATRRAVAACRHMKVAAVTLTPDHDMISGATNMHERQMAYQMFLKMAWSDKPRWESMTASGHVRRLLDYRRTGGFAVFLYLLSKTHVRIRPLSANERAKTLPELAERLREIKRKHYHSLSPERKRVWHLKVRERNKARYRTDPEFRARELLRVKHRKHLAGVVPRVPCSLC